jgi:hypothetical protein
MKEKLVDHMPSPGPQGLMLTPRECKFPVWVQRDEIHTLQNLQNTARFSLHLIWLSAST